MELGIGAASYGHHSTGRVQPPPLRRGTTSTLGVTDHTRTHEVLQGLYRTVLLRLLLLLLLLPHGTVRYNRFNLRPSSRIGTSPRPGPGRQLNE